MTRNSWTDHPSVAVLLSGREQFSSYFGGASARWTYEVYSKLKDLLAVTVFGFPTEKKNLYPLPHATSSVAWACEAMAQIPVARRYEEKVWLRSLIQRLRKFDIAHIHNRPQWVSALRELDFDGKIVLHLHNDHLGHWPRTSLDGLARGLDALAVCSEYLRQTFASKSSAICAKTSVVHNGANLQLFQPREDLREPKTIFFVGRFNSEKGVLQLLKAYERVLPEHPDAKLVIGGTTDFGTHRETPYVREVREFAQSLTENKGAQVHFPGYLDHDHVLPLYFQKATVFACPSIFQEPFGMVNTEAMACATTVVGSNRGGIPEVLGDAGILIDPENTREFASGISELLANPEYCRKQGQAGYDRCRRRFDWHVTADSWMRLIEATMLSRTKITLRS